MKQKCKNVLRRHPLATAAGYLLLYLAVFQLLQLWQRPVLQVHCRLDDMMPFWKWAVIPYVLWFAWVPAVFLLLLRRAPEAYWKALCGQAVGTATALTLYVLLPTGLHLRQRVYGTDLAAQLLRLIYRVDPPVNVCPSLHVFVTVLLLLVLLGTPGVVSTAARHLNVWIALAICTSTVLIDQHSVIDVACGLLLALGVYGRVCRTQARQPERTPRRRAWAGSAGGR